MAGATGNLVPAPDKVGGSTVPLKDRKETDDPAVLPKKQEGGSLVPKLKEKEERTGVLVPSRQDIRERERERKQKV